MTALEGFERLQIVWNDLVYGLGFGVFHGGHGALQTVYRALEDLFID